MKNTPTIIKSAKVVFYLLLGWQFATVHWFGESKVDFDLAQIAWTYEKPAVYRQLIPLFARLLMWVTDARVDIALVGAITIAAVSAMMAIGVFLAEFQVQKLHIYELAFAVILFVFLLKDAKVYDFATIATFSLCLVLLHRQLLGWYQAVFFLACLNRETAFLLILFFIYHFWGKLECKTFFTHLIIQVVVFAGVRVMMFYKFFYNPGTLAQFNIFKNLREFINSPFLTIIVITIILGLFYLTITVWPKIPKFLQEVVIVFVPLLALMYIFLGRAFELRVFIEVFPALFVIIAIRINNRSMVGLDT